MPNLDQYDYDVKEKEERPEIPFSLNFKTISAVMLRTQESLTEWDDKYPKKQLMGLMVGIYAVCFALICASVGAFVILTLPMLFFYILALRSVYVTWKQCGYSKSKFIVTTIIVFVVAAVVAYFIQYPPFK